MVLNWYKLRTLSPLIILRPARGTDATIAPFRRQIEQSHRRGSTIPSGKSSSSTTAPQWHVARCFGFMTVFPTCLIMLVSPSVLHNVEAKLWPACGSSGLSDQLYAPFAR